MNIFESIKDIIELIEKNPENINEIKEEARKMETVQLIRLQLYINRVIEVEELSEKELKNYYLLFNEINEIIFEKVNSLDLEEQEKLSDDIALLNGELSINIAANVTASINAETFTDEKREEAIKKLEYERKLINIDHRTLGMYFNIFYKSKFKTM